MNEQTRVSTEWAQNQHQNTLHLAYWTLAWLVTTAIAAFGPRKIWDFATVPTMLAVAVNLGVGFGMIVAIRRHLRGLDELHRKIFLDATALSMSVGMVVGLAYELLEDIKLISHQPEISHVVMLMSVTFMVGMISGHRKYQ